MAKLNRADIIKKLHKVLKKHFTPVPTPHDRTVLEHLLFACCLEDARHELAEECFARVQQLYFDWNEIRVTTTRELSEVFASLPDSMGAATRLKSSLQSIFETRYEFDLEFLKKMKLGDAQKKLASLRGPSLFVQSYVTQASLSGHAIPTSAGSLQVLELVGAATGAEVAGGSVPGLERAIPKNQGIEFGSLLHTLGSHFTADPKSTLVKNVLAEVNPESVDRLAKLLARKAAPPEPAPAPPARRSEKEADKGKEAAKSKEPDKTAGKMPEKSGEKGLDKAKVEPGKAGAKAEPTPVKPAAGKDKGGQSAPSKPAAPDKNRPAPAQPASEGTKGVGKAKPAAAVAKPVDKKTEAHKPESHQPDGHKTDSHAEGAGKGADKKGNPSAVAPVSKETKKPAPPVKTEPAKSDTAKPIVGKPAAAKPGTGKPGTGKPDNHQSDHNKSDSSKSAGRKASGPPAKPTGKKPTEGKSSEGKSSDGGASKSKTASKQLTRRKPR